MTILIEKSGIKNKTMEIYFGCYCWTDINDSDTFRDCVMVFGFTHLNGNYIAPIC